MIFSLCTPTHVQIDLLWQRLCKYLATSSPTSQGQVEQNGPIWIHIQRLVCEPRTFCAELTLQTNRLTN